VVLTVTIVVKRVALRRERSVFLVAYLSTLSVSRPCSVNGGMINGLCSSRWNESWLGRKPDPVPLCPTQIPIDTAARQEDSTVVFSEAVTN
jgi:hypothetical protein